MAIKDDEVKDITKKQAQPVHLAKNEIIIQKADDPVGSLGDTDQVDEADHRDEQAERRFSTFP